MITLIIFIVWLLILSMVLIFFAGGTIFEKEGQNMVEVKTDLYGCTQYRNANLLTIEGAEEFYSMNICIKINDGEYISLEKECL